MIDLIGLPVDQAVKIVEDKGLKATVVVNNFCVSGDKTLITNAKAQGDEVVLTVGEFIFELKE